MRYFSKCCDDQLDYGVTICSYCGKDCEVEEYDPPEDHEDHEIDEDIPLENDELEEPANYYDNDSDFEIGGES